MPHLLVLRHGPLVGPDQLVPSLDGRTPTLAWVEHDLTDDPTVPALTDEVKGVLVLGGIMGVHDDDAWLEPERAFLRDAIAAGVPTMGICLGAQQLGAALGGDVTRLPETNISAPPLHRTDAGRDHDVMAGFPDGAPMVFHHDDAVSTLPDGAVVLLEGASPAISAWTDATDTALAVQFHPEVSPAGVRAWEELRGDVREEFLAEVTAAAATTRSVGISLVMRWLDMRVLKTL